MQMDCASIILPITPPALLVAHMRMGLRLSFWAVIFCKPPKRTFEDVSLPVRATPSQPMKVPKKGKNQPVRVNARPKTALLRHGRSFRSCIHAYGLVLSFLRHGRSFRCRRKERTSPYA